MKQSIFKKHLHVNGTQQKVYGAILITKNITSKATTIRNPSTHEDSISIVALHQIDGFIEDTLFKSIGNLRTESQIIKAISALEEELLKEMSVRAFGKAEDPFIEELIKLGFKL